MRAPEDYLPEFIAQLEKDIAWHRDQLKELEADLEDLRAQLSSYQSAQLPAAE